MPPPPPASPIFPSHSSAPSPLPPAAPRYKGQGRIAGEGAGNARWVPSEMLVFNNLSPMTFGAQLGFVWNVPGERRFLILLHRVDLEACSGK